MQVFEAVAAHGVPNVHVTRVPLPTILYLKEWANICQLEEDAITPSYLTFGFPAGYERPVPTPSFGNHSSAIKHS